MIVIELLLYFTMLMIVGLIITQFIVPTLKNEQTWWMFKKHSTKKQLETLYIELSKAQDVIEIKEISKKINKLNK